MLSRVTQSHAPSDRVLTVVYVVYVVYVPDFDEDRGQPDRRRAMGKLSSCARNFVGAIKGIISGGKVNS